MIEVGHLCKAYGNISAVDGIALTVEPGGTVGRLETTGCKTNTILTVGGALRPDTRSIAIDGAIDPTRQARRRRRPISYLSVRDYLAAKGKGPYRHLHYALEGAPRGAFTVADMLLPCAILLCGVRQRPPAPV